MRHPGGSLREGGCLPVKGMIYRFVKSCRALKEKGKGKRIFKVFPVAFRCVFPYSFLFSHDVANFISIIHPVSPHVRAGGFVVLCRGSICRAGRCFYRN